MCCCCNISKTTACQPSGPHRKCVLYFSSSVQITNNNNNNNNNTKVVSELQALQTYITSSPSKWTRALTKLLLHEQIVQNSNQCSKRNRIRDHKINGSINHLQSPIQSQNKTTDQTLQSTLLCNKSNPIQC